MNVSRAKIEVVIVVMMLIGVVMMVFAIGVLIMAVMMVPMIVAKEPGACQVHAQPKDSDCDCFIIGNGDRMNEAVNTLVADENRDHAKHDGACEAREVAELSRPEGETVIVDMTPRVRVGEGRYRERCRVGGHVPAIRHESQRAKRRSANDLANHHDGSKADNGPNALRILVVTSAQEHMIVLERLD